ncbi:hypothetical protein M752DRAFT_215127 [Aspergillus phoenicis ATCC 13157]|uniref:F-box domain-containing protein n=1 Tax=Aspergillus phoenicis ATCC 13157 TaxID=1353007 RepID=A0A370PJN1_ASPPH|nr:hypothetical protein M752DRAFT_215127 [Aspergillus phoenicis ATCC 13157]
MSVITVSEPVPDITGVVNNICILCDSTGAFEEGIPYKMEEDTSLDVYYLLSLMRDILKDPFLSPAILQLERDIYEIVSSQWIFCLRQSAKGGAVWTDGVIEVPLTTGGVMVPENMFDIKAMETDIFKALLSLWRSIGSMSDSSAVHQIYYNEFHIVSVMRALFLNTKDNYSGRTSNEMTRANSNSLSIASMPSSKNVFSSPPVIVVDTIVGYLDLKSIKSLRLTNRAWRDLCLGPYFKSFFHHQVTNLTTESLRSLIPLARHPILSRAIRKLTIIAEVYDPSLLKRVLRTRRCEDRARIPHLAARDCSQDELKQAKLDLEWLEARSSASEIADEDNTARSLAAILNHIGQLDTIALEATAITAPHPDTFRTQGDWQIIWAKASQIYHIVMLALSQSSIVMNNLTIYRETIRCAVPCNEITANMDNLDTRGCSLSTGQSIRCLALDLSMRIDSNPVLTDGLDGVARLLQNMPNLESLVLGLRRTVRGDASSYHRFFDTIADTVRLPLLSKLTLLGIYTTSSSLLQFLQNHQGVRELHLEKVDLTSGSWSPLFQYFQELLSLRRLILSRISLAGQHLNLRPVPDNEDRSSLCDPDYYHCIRGIFVHRREFDVFAIRQGFHFNQEHQGAPSNSLAFTAFLIYGYEIKNLTSLQMSLYSPSSLHLGVIVHHGAPSCRRSEYDIKYNYEYYPDKYHPYDA